MKHFFTRIALCFALALPAQLLASGHTQGDEPVVATPGGDVVASDVNTYPNPVINDLFIEMKSDNFMPSEWKVFDMLGNIVLEGKLEQAEKVRLDLSTLKSEVYFLRLFDENGQSLTKRIIKK